MECPICDGQGIINKAIISKTKTPIFICDECDATWSTKTQIGAEHFLQFSQLMESNGLPGLWSQLEQIEPTS